MTDKKRIHFLDAARGIIIILMILYHFLYDMAWMYNMRWAQWLYLQPLMSAAEVAGAAVFIVITGITSHLTHSNIKRGIKILAAALVITVVTIIIMPEDPIYFGILHFMGVSVILYGLIQKYLPKWFYSPLWLAVFLVCYFLLKDRRFDIPNLYFLGFPDAAFSSADYFPILPWIFMYFFGLWCGKIVVAGKFPKWFYKTKVPVIDFVGRYPLIIYVLHQPVVFGLLWMLFGQPKQI